jgi:uncharacterized protein YegL
MSGLAVTDQDFVVNREQRTPCILLLDISGSMNGPPIRELNEGLKVFENEIKRDETAALRCEIAIVSFGGRVERVVDFISIGQFAAPQLEARGDTPMGGAIHLALDTIRQRKESYRRNKINYTRPWLFLLSDGAPTDHDVWPAAVQRLRQEEHAKGVLVFPIGVERADMSVLAQLSSQNAPQKLFELKFAQFFQWLSVSQHRASTEQAGRSVQLPSVQGWVQAGT